MFHTGTIDCAGMSATRFTPPSYYAREFHRFALPTPVMVRSGWDNTNRVTANLSLGGCTIESVLPCPVGTFLMLTLLLPNEAPFLSIDRAVVQWQRDHVLGLEFVQVSERSKHSPNALVWDELIYKMTKEWAGAENARPQIIHATIKGQIVATQNSS